MSDFKNGDWITVNTIIGEKKGFIEDMTPWNILFRPVKDGQLQDVLFVTREKARLRDLEITQEDIEGMIDQALATNDKQWFEELTEMLTTMKSFEELF